MWFKKRSNKMLNKLFLLKSQSFTWKKNTIIVKPLLLSFCLKSKSRKYYYISLINYYKIIIIKYILLNYIQVNLFSHIII